MNGDILQAAVERYNSFVEAGQDVDFGKPKPKHKIQTPPFYAAWATPNVHDTRSGLRINAKCQVMDMNGSGYSRPLLRWRVGRRLQSAWLGSLHDTRIYRRHQRGAGSYKGLN